MIVRTGMTSMFEVDTVAKTAAIVFLIPAKDGEGDVEVFRQNVTAQLDADDRRRLRHLLDADGAP